MKIYQLHEYGGEYEDSYDRIIGSYLRKERAEEEKAKAEVKEKELREHHNRCSRCPLIDDDCECDPAVSIEELLNQHVYYCNEPKLYKHEYGVDCENYYLHWDESRFYIKEVEVEE